MEIFILIILILLNGIFAMSEIALVTARKARLMPRAAAGDKSAQAAIRLGENPTRFLSTIQIGITSIGLLSGIVGEAALAAPLSAWMQESLGIPSSTSGMVATIVVVAAVTYLSIVVGELVPKRLGQIAPEKMACLVARPMTLLAVISRPFVALLAWSTGVLLRLLKVNTDEGQPVTEEEIQAMIDESSEAGAIESKQRDMLRNIFRLDDRPAVSIMTPRIDIRYLDTLLSPGENIDILSRHEHSWLPVCRGGLKELVGVIRTNQALLLCTGTIPDAEEFSRALEEGCQPPVFVPETLTSLEVLKLLQERGVHIAFIVDEYGTVQGLVTPRDILEVLAGQIGNSREDSWAIQRENGSWLLDGSIPVPELKDKLGLQSLPAEDKGYYTILSGMIMFMAGRIPREGDHIEWQGWRFEVVDMDGNMIDKVLVERLPEEKMQEAEA
ncbi:hemolysin family protein [Mailhella massiliensis]|uniref:Hemolysin family protein n=1 Tax=Mailhella massiliensis TaxID=1903261 RepID=A0A921DSE8_9BACT|nr:hemolysin family protein [Mailhella massiliensis]HJD96872.1 hemolysin family protein [Mailhella massiliensis]